MCRSDTRASSFVLIGGKLKFTLEPLYQYAVFSPLLRLAVREGYKVKKLHGAAVWYNVPPVEKGLFRSYVAREMREKDEASGWPSNVTTDQEKQAYMQKYASHPLNKLLGLELRSAKVENNPGRKSVAKLRLNNLWGKMTQKEVYPQTQIFHGDDNDKFFSLLQNPRYRVMRLIVLHDNMIEVCYKDEAVPSSSSDTTDEDPRPTGSLHSVIPGALVPMYGQIEMYEYMKRIGEQRCYMDTDSFIYRYDPENKDHEEITEIGDFLGQFKDELGKKRVTRYASGGAKNYVLLYDDGKGDSTVKGIQRGKLAPHYQASYLRAEIMHSCLTDMGVRDLAAPPQHTVEFTRFLRDRDTQTVSSDAQATRRYRLVNDKVELFVDGSSLPIGHEDVESKRQEFESNKDGWTKTYKKELRDLVTDFVPSQDRWDNKRVGTLMARHENKQQQLEEKKQARLDRQQQRLQRERVIEMPDDADHDQARIDDWLAASGSRPDPEMFDGMMD